MPYPPLLSFFNFPGDPGGRARPLSEADAEVITHAVNDPELRPYFNRIYPESVTSEREWITSLDKDRSHFVVGIEVDHDTTPLLIGSMGLHDINLVHGTATTGTMIWDQRYWNRGIGTNVKMMLLNHAFNRLNLRIVYSRVAGFNERSRHYGEKCGYRVVGQLNDRFRYGTKTYHEYILEVRPEWWQPYWDNFAAKHKIEAQEAMITRHSALNR